MAAGAEDKAGVEPKRKTSVLRRFLPFWHDDEFFADLDRLIILAPVVLPIAVLNTACSNIAVRGVDAAEHGKAVLIVGQVALDAADAGELVFKFVIDIVPILVVLFEEILEILLVLDDEAAGSHVRHFLTARIYLRAGRVDCDFYITHSILQNYMFYLKYSNPFHGKTASGMAEKLIASPVAG